jgi:hypothetical protein
MLVVRRGKHVNLDRLRIFDLELLRRGVGRKLAGEDQTEKKHSQAEC